MRVQARARMTCAHDARTRSAAHACVAQQAALCRAHACVCSHARRARALPLVPPRCLPRQVAISTEDVYRSAEQIRAAGGAITREPGPVPGIGTKILATTDPDGYKYVLVDNADFLKELE